MPAKKLLLGWVTANLMGFNKWMTWGRCWCHRSCIRNPPLACFLSPGGGEGRQMEGSCPSPCRLEALSGKQDLLTPSTALSRLQKHSALQQGSHSPGHLLVENAHSWSLVPSWDGNEAAKASSIRSSDDSGASVLRTTVLETPLKLQVLPPR